MTGFRLFGLTQSFLHVARVAAGSRLIPAYTRCGIHIMEYGAALAYVFADPAVASDSF